MGATSTREILRVLPQQIFLGAHELTSRIYGEKKWWVVIVKDQ